MADFRIRLTDGVTGTVDLYSGSDSYLRYGGLAMPAPRVAAPFQSYTQADGGRLPFAKYEDRQITIGARIKGSSLADLKTNIRTIHRLLNDAKEHTINDRGATVSLEYQWGDASGESTFFDVLRGDLTLPVDYLSHALRSQFEIPNAAIALTCKPFGRYANQSLAMETLENDNLGTTVNYKDIVTSESYGDVPARMYIKLTQNGGVGTSTVWIAKRSGTDYQDNLWKQSEDYSGTAHVWASGGTIIFAKVADATMSGGTVLSMDVRRLIGFSIAGSSEVMYADYAFATPPRGQFRVLLRGKAKVAPAAAGETAPAVGNTAWGFGWVYGDKKYAPTAAKSEFYTNSTGNVYQTLDLGLVNIPPVAESDVVPANQFTLRIYGLARHTLAYSAATRGTVTWTHDFVTLLPIDEGAVIMGTVKPTDAIAIDGITDPPQVYKISSGGTVSDYPDYRGAPFTLGREDTRLYILKDDPKTVSFDTTITYQPQFLSI